MTEERGIKIDKDLFGIGWVTDREPTKEEIESKGFCTLTQEATIVEPRVYYHHLWDPGVDIAWRNDATVAAAKKEQEKLAENQEVITWRYDEPDHRTQTLRNFIAQSVAGLWCEYWNESTVRWTILSVPKQKKMTVKEFCEKWGAKHSDCFVGDIYKGLGFVVVPPGRVIFERIFEGNADELLKDVKEVWGED